MFFICILSLWKRKYMCSNLFLESSVLAFQGVLEHLSSKSHILWHFSDLIANKLNFFWGTQTKIQSELSRQNKNGQIRLSLIISILRHWAWTYWRGKRSTPVVTGRRLSKVLSHQNRPQEGDMVGNQACSPAILNLPSGEGMFMGDNLYRPLMMQENEGSW